MIARARDSVKLITLEGHYKPCYMNGNPKIQKNLKNPPMRPIASHIGA